MTNEWTSPDHVRRYLEKMEDIPHRQQGEATLLSEVPKEAKRILDLGCGNGHLLALLLSHCPDATGVSLDLSEPMLDQARQKFQGSTRIELINHNMEQPLPALGMFDVIASSFAIHHCEHPRKRQLYQEIHDRLTPGGIFCNLEHVDSPSERVHQRFLQAMAITPEEEDPSNKLLDVETQLQWLREIGFDDVDCYWKWRELALLIGRKPC